VTGEFRNYLLAGKGGREGKEGSEMMKIRKMTYFWFVPLSLILVLAVVLSSCQPGDKKACCLERGGISLDFSSLPLGTPLVMFTVNNLVGVRIHDRIYVEGTSLWCRGSEEVPPGSGHWQDAAVMLVFSRVSCRICALSAGVHGHGHEARIVATQQDGTTQTAVCPGNQRTLKLKATRDNPFIYAILSGQEAEWLSFRLE
jgi:hypothetical protein